MELFVLSPTPTCPHTHTHTHTHTLACTHTYKHNNVCLYGFSREQRHFQAEIIFSPAEYLPRTLMCVCVCVCVFEWERVQVCVCLRYYFLRPSSPQDIKEKKKRRRKKRKRTAGLLFVPWNKMFCSCRVWVWARVQESGKCKHPNEEAKSYLYNFLLLNQSSFGFPYWRL